jgi:HD-like signal output (HDOD) protein
VADRLLSSERAPDDDEMERLIRSDAALAGRIVKIANSPFYLSVMPVGSLYSAMMRLGLNQCRRIAMTAALEGAILPPGSVRVFERLRRHGLLTGHIAEALAPAFESDPGEAFLAGLLHDVGDTLVRRAVPTAAQGDPEMDAAVESAALWLHQRVGTLLFAHWDLPAAIAAAIAAHHHPDHADPRFARLAWLIHVADPLAERAQEHSRSKAWQAAASAMAAGSAPPSSDGVELIDVRDLGRAIPGGLPESILHGAARAGLQRMMGADV